MLKGMSTLAVAALLGATAIWSSAAIAQRSPANQATVLSLDSRLRKTVTVREVDRGLTDLFATVRRASRVSLYTRESELQHARLVAGCKNQPVEALMDAVSALWLVRWEKDQPGRYELLVSEAELSVYQPQNKFQEERFAHGRRFSEGLKKLPVALRAMLLSNQRFSPNALPPDMLSSVRAMVDALNQEYAESGDTNPFPLHRLPEAAIRLEHKNPRGVNSFFLTLELPGWGSMGWLFSDHTPATTSDRLYVPQKLKLRREQAAKLPALQQRVSVEAEQATLTEIVQALYQRHGIPFVADADRKETRRADVRIQNKPLAEALDRLVEVYQGYEWEYRELGFLVFRAPDNPATQAPPAPHN